MTVPATPAPDAGLARLWLRGLGSRRDTAHRRLFVFPHAGAGAGAYRLAEHVPDTVEVCTVQLPGREDRFGEDALTSTDAVVTALAPLIAGRTELPYAFFGHSMGALVAFEVARGLRDRGAALPGRLFLSAMRAPGVPDREPLHHLPDDALLARLAADELAGLDPELQELLLPLMRADLTLCETYAHRAAAPLPCPFTVLHGTEDDTVGEADLAGWREHTAAGCDTHRFPGGHLYVRDAQQQLARTITRTAPAWA
ncbi:thioesterase [Streptomyces lucensis JCM 4490]|uniref:Thioesterase n=1 Tax=Streptomyces lucensis JCM 4490 TaxID=1306176 RepID=A0A918J6W3_9ACTN|nr:alpha/beta fold hydrolase [Streptomyces lucensis]GGW53280.1 thioesterase [Streptomyces lucensis JCM 4490]